MKFLIIAVVLLGIIIGAGIWEQSVVAGTFKEFNSKVEKIEANIDDNEKALEHTEDLVKWWHKERELIEALCPYDDIKEITLRVAELKGSLIVKDKDMALIQVSILKAICENVPHLLDFQLGHIL